MLPYTRIPQKNRYELNHMRKTHDKLLTMNFPTSIHSKLSIQPWDMTEESDLFVMSAGGLQELSSLVA